jgi:hypothetical protein
VISCSRGWLVPSSLGGSASPEDDGERVAEGPNIRRQSRSYFANALRTTRSTLRYREWLGFPAFGRKRRDSRKHWALTKDPSRAAGRQRNDSKLRKEIRSPVRGMKSPIRGFGCLISHHLCVSWAKNSLEQASELIVHLFFDLVGSSAQVGRLFL